jgi:hypothetical protein
MAEDAKQELINSPIGKPKKKVFVIMPFTKTPLRKQAELAEFFEVQLKGVIEGKNFKHEYEVSRSGQELIITDQIIRELFRADLVICDLSGEHANPNVMYELGIRLACSNRPVILIREEHPSNERIFDIQSLHVHNYNPLAPKSLSEYLYGKIRAFEDGEEIFRSPVLDVLEDEANFQRVGKTKAKILIDILQFGLLSHLRSLIVTLNSYLVGRSNIQLTLTPGDLARDLFEHQDQLRLVDWSEIRLAAGPHPAISYYLSTQYLAGIVDDKLEIPFSGVMLFFYEWYFTNLAWWFNFDLSRLISFCQHATMIAHACTHVRNLLLAEEGDPAYVEASDMLVKIISLIKA